MWVTKFIYALHLQVVLPSFGERYLSTELFELERREVEALTYETIVDNDTISIM